MGVTFVFCSFHETRVWSTVHFLPSPPPRLTRSPPHHKTHHDLGSHLGNPKQRDLGLAPIIAEGFFPHALEKKDRQSGFEFRLLCLTSQVRQRGVSAHTSENPFFGPPPEGFRKIIFSFLSRVMRKKVFRNLFWTKKRTFTHTQAPSFPCLKWHYSFFHFPRPSLFPGRSLGKSGEGGGERNSKNPLTYLLFPPSVYFFAPLLQK